MKNDITVIKTESRTHTFYLKDGRLFVYSAGSVKAIAENASHGFSVCAGKNSLPVVFHRDKLGAYFLTSFGKDGNQETRRLSPHSSFAASEYCEYFQSEALGPCFFYSGGSGGSEGFFAADFSEGEEKTIRLGSYLPMKTMPFYVFGSTLPYVFFRTDTNILSLCVFNGGIKDFSLHTISKKCSEISDISCAVCGSRLHMAYTIEDKASCHLMYKYFENGRLSGGKVILTCVKGASPFIFISQENIFVFALLGTKGLYAFSDNNGETFSHSSKFYKPVAWVSKAKYICGNSLVLEVPVDSSNKPLILDDFEPRGSDDGIRVKYEKLREQVVSYENNLKNKTMRVQEMSNALAQNQQQSDHLMHSWRVRLEEVTESLNRAVVSAEEAKAVSAGLSQENGNLRAELDSLKSELNSCRSELLCVSGLNEEISRLSEENRVLKKAKELLEQELYRVNNKEDFDE